MEQVRKAHMMNANHLLNFYYDPIVRHHPRGATPPPPPPPRRQQKIKPYKGDCFKRCPLCLVASHRMTEWHGG